MLHLDFESASRVDLKERGLDNYSKDPSTHVLMLAWAINEALPQVWFPQDGPMPEQLELMIRRPEIKKAAFNAEFERTILRDVLKIETAVSAWDDPMINARYASIAGNLEFVGKVLGLPEDKAKLKTGKALIKFFCSPNKKGEFNTREEHPEKCAQFVDYCKQDVIAEREIGEKLKAFRLTEKEKKVFLLDQKINERGIPTDTLFGKNANAIIDFERAKLTREMCALTGLENPNSPKQLLPWLKSQGYPYGSLGKKWITKALGNTDGVGFQNTGVSQNGRRGLELRQQLAKSSVSKLVTLAQVVNADGYLRRQYVYYGAARTGRWSGRAVQMQNLPRGSMKKFDEAVEAIRQYAGPADIDKIRAFGPPLEVVANCLKGAFRAPNGKRFIACDLSTIEVRILGWLAECLGINEVFEQGLDPYKSFGVRFYKKPYEAITKEERQVCKPAVLQCGYQAGGGELKRDKNGDVYKSGLWGYAEEYGVDMTQEAAAEAVALYRETYPEVVAFWRKCENASIAALQTGEPQRVGPVVFGAVKPCKMLWILLPSGRRLHYIRPQLETEDGWDGTPRTKLSYEGNLIGKIWGCKHAYGGIWTENLCQAIARDVLVEGMLAADAGGFTLVGSTHDELLSLEDENSSLNLAALRQHMITRPTWAPDLMLDADGWEDQIYRKE